MPPTKLDFDMRSLTHATPTLEQQRLVWKIWLDCCSAQTDCSKIKSKLKVNLTWIKYYFVASHKFMPPQKDIVELPETFFGAVY